MAGTLEPRIIGLLSKDRERLCSIADISKELKVAYSHAHTFVTRLIEQDVVMVQKVGKTIVCRLNLKQPLTLAKLSEQSYLSALEWQKKDPRAGKIMERVQRIKEQVHSILVHNNKIIILVPEQSKDADFSLFKNRKVLTAYEMRKNKNFYTESVIIYGAEKYWSLIEDA